MTNAAERIWVYAEKHGWRDGIFAYKDQSQLEHRTPFVPECLYTAACEELHLMKTAGIVEVAVRNPSVAEYMRHWEGRAEAAERKLALREICADGDDFELRKERDALRAALMEIEGGAGLDHWNPALQHCIDIARQALKGTPNAD